MSGVFPYGLCQQGEIFYFEQFYIVQYVFVREDPDGSRYIVQLHQLGKEHRQPFFVFRCINDPNSRFGLIQSRFYVVSVCQERQREQLLSPGGRAYIQRVYDVVEPADLFYGLFYIQNNYLLFFKLHVFYIIHRHIQRFFHFPLQRVGIEQETAWR